MKKVIKYIFVFIIISFAFIYRVNAAVSSCRNGFTSRSVTIKEKSTIGEPAGFDVWIPVCDRRVYQGYKDIFTGSSYPNVKDYAKEEVLSYYSTVDLKDTNAVYVPRCDDVNTAISAVSYAYYWANPDPVYKKMCYYEPDTVCETKTTKNSCNSVRDHNGKLCTWTATSSSTTGASPSSSYQDSNYSNSVKNMSTQSYDSIIAADNDDSGSCSAKRERCVWDYAYDENGKKIIDHYVCKPGFEDYTFTPLLKIDNIRRTNVCYKKVEDRITSQCITDGLAFTSRETNPNGTKGKCIPGEPSTSARQANLINKEPLEVLSYINGTWCYAVEIDSEIGEGCYYYDLKYTLHCPIYKCIVDDELISACTPTFQVKSTNEAAYCVNPSDHFASGGSREAEYVVDDTFSAKDCSNSYNTVECGYANILIEGEKKGLSSKAIDLALRLWGVHSGQTGFDNVGINVTTGPGCRTSKWFAARYGVGFNVYKETYKYIMQTEKNNYFEKANTLFDDGYLDPVGQASEFGITGYCSAGDRHSQLNADGELEYVLNNSNYYAVAHCNNNVYKQAIGLLFNTILGNKQMQNHLYEISGGKPIEPVDADFGEFIVEGEPQYRVTVTYEEEEFEKIFEVAKREVIDCSKLDTDPVLKEHKDEISPYCTTKTTLYGLDNSVLDTGRVRECVKQTGCHREVTLSHAICDRLWQSKMPYKILTEYKTTEMTKDVVRYLPCSGEGYQFLYALIDTRPGGGGEVGSTSTPRYVTGQKTFEVTGYLCYGEFCDDTSIKEIPDPKDGNDKQCKSDLTYGGVYTKTIKDPSLKCIMNIRNETVKETYDYSNYFHVNTDLCRIYCSDTIEYKIADKVVENSARNFKYNITSSTGFSGKTDIPLSSAVKETRTCVSEIYYHDLTKNLQDIRKKYNLTEELLPSLINLSAADARVQKNLGFAVTEIATSSGTRYYRAAAVPDLLEALTKKATGYTDREGKWVRGENNRGENINQVIYDLYNCNLFSSNSPSSVNFGSVQAGTDKAPVTGSTVIRKPQDSKTGIARYYINEEYSASNSYGLAKTDDCDILPTGEKKTCIEHAIQTYDFAAEVDGKTGSEIELLGITNSSLQAIKYCTGDNCFKYDKDDEENAYNYGTSNTTNRTINYTTNLKSINFTTVKLPTNDYAYFDIHIEVGFYNKSLFEVEPDTGKVYYDSSAHNYLVNESYTYPTDKYSFNNCANLKSNPLTDGPNCVDSTGLTPAQISEFNENFSRCSITQKFNNVVTFYRKNYNDEFKRAVNNNKEFSCYVDVLKPEASDGEFYYRNVDPANLFPNGYISSNWRTTEGSKAKLQIENTADQIKFTDDLLDYTITLTPQQINNIKEYNSTTTSSGYIDEPINRESCTIIPDVKDGSGKITEYGYYTECKSDFLDKLRDGTSTSRNSLGTIETGPHSKN